jgi:hypothetical protein
VIDCTHGIIETELNVVRDMLVQRMHHNFSGSPNSLEKHIPLRASVSLVTVPVY